MGKHSRAADRCGFPRGLPVRRAAEIRRQTLWYAFAAWLGAVTRRRLPRPVRPRGAGRRLIRGGVFARIGLGLACLLQAQSRQPAPGEAQIKAAFVYNFAKFVEWPDEAASPAAPMLVGVVGDPQLADVVGETLQGKNVRGHPFLVRHFPSPENLALCHILLVTSQDTLAVQRTLHTARASPTLTIGDLPGFSDQGGVIELVLEDNKFRFEINAGAARRSGLKVSSRLLRLARSVKGN